MREVIVAGCLVACTTGSVVDVTDVRGTTSPGPQRPPPGDEGIDLQVEGVLAIGGTLTFTASGLRPGQRVFFAGATEHVEAAWCPPVLQRLCVDLPAPKLVATAVANADGIARIDRVVPAIVAERWWFQAITARPFAATSDVVGRYVLKHGTFLPVTLQTLHLSGPVLTGAVLEVGAWADANNYAGRPWACYASTPLTAAPSVATTPCPGCEYAWQIKLTEPFVEVDVDAGCADYFGYDASFFDDLFAPGSFGSTQIDGGWAGLGGGAEWGIDLDHYDPYFGTVTPIVLFYEPSQHTWYPFGPLSRTFRPTYDEVVIGAGYQGGFTY